MANAASCRTCVRALGLSSRRLYIEAPILSLTIPRTSVSRLPAVGSCTVTQHRRYATTPSQRTSPIEANSTATSTDPVEKVEAASEDTSDFRETYVAKEKSEILFKECARQADYFIPQAFEKDGEVPKNASGEEIGEGTGWWYETLGLQPTFNTWFQITSLHLYLLTVRIRYLPPQRSAIWLQHLHDHFFYEAEHRMNLFHRISSRAIRNRYLKDLYNQWRGVQAAYDEGLVKGDAVLATAIWRNILKADEDADWTKVAQITSYVRRGLRGLDRTTEQTLVDARIKFAGPASEVAIVEGEARGMSAPFEESDKAEFEAFEKDKAGYLADEK